MTSRKISRGVRAKPDPKPRAPALLPSLLRALDARPDVTVLTREWPVVIVKATYVLDKTVVNPDGFSPLHRETPRFIGQALQLMKMGAGALLTAIPNAFCGEDEAAIMGPLDIAAWPIHPEVSARLGLSAPVERGQRITGAALER